jgi:restriction endonuclease S subunit/predicted RNA methylase
MSSPILESKMIEEKTKLPENKILWELSQNVEENEDYLQLRNTLLGKIKTCHDILRNNESICGTKARDDIMRILCLIMLKHKFVNEDEELMKKCEKLKNDKKTVMSVEEYDTYMTYCKETEKLPKSGDVLDNWRLFVNDFLTKIFNTIYFEDDEKFNFQNENTFIQLFECLNSSIIDDKFIDSFETSCGDIHEMFLAYGDKAVAKELGQYFTPRHLIHLIFHGIKAPDIKSPKIYDPCAGTCGFLTRIFKLHKMKTRHIYGCEIEKDTIKFGQLSLILNTKSIKNNLENCNSLCQNPFIFTKRFDYIYTNPPFGTKMKYKDLKMKFTKYKDENYPDVDIHFEDVYPIAKNDGTCLFIQHCVYVLEDGGFCAIVLPDGRLFNSRNFKKFREWLCDNVNILTIVKVPSGVFEHTNIKTNVLCFQKDGKTENINFVKTNQECNVLQTIFDVSIDELKENGFSFDENEYIIESKIKYSAPVVKLGDVCEFLKKSKRKASYGKKTGKYPFYTSSQICKKYVDEFDYENKCIIVGTGGTANIKMDNNFSCSTDNFIFKIKNTSLVEYVFLYLTYNLKLLENGFKGVGLKHISKEYLKKIEIPLPTLEIQNKIIEELSKLETSIQTLELRNEQLKNEKEQFRKYGLFEKINELLHGAEIKKLNEICEINPKNKLNVDDFEYINYIEISSVKEGDLVAMTKINKKYPSRAKRIIEKNDILFSSVRPNLRGYLHLKKNIENCVASTGFAQIRKKIEKININIDYIYHILTTEQQIIYLISKTKGCTYPSLSFNIFETIKIPLPTLKKQEQLIVLYEKKEKNINKINDKIKSNTKHIQKLKELGKNIIISFCN